MIKKRKIRVNISIRQRIYLSFSLLVFLFVVNGILTIITLNRNKKLSEQITKVNEPSLQLLDNFNKMLIESKMYSTNWVFLRFDEGDKNALIKLHTTDYRQLKAGLTALSLHWRDRGVDTLHKIFHDFEVLLSFEKIIMGSLKGFDDYDDPSIRPEAERIVDEEVMPRTDILRTTLDNLIRHGRERRVLDEATLEGATMKLRMYLILLAVSIICAGIFLSMYMTRIIISPIKRIRHIINELGKGITVTNRHNASKDEIGKMVLSVNNLSEKLRTTAAFAHEVGLRNFNMPFKPLSDEDTLGKALLAMRDNIKSIDEKFNQAQRIAHLGSWERDLATDKMYLSDEMFNILDIDPAEFDFLFPSIVSMIHPDDLAQFEQHGRRNLRKYHTSAYECRIITKKGATKNIYVQSKTVLDEDGEITATVGTAQDITERKDVEKQIKLSNERYELVTKTTNDMIWDWDLVTNTIFRNENYNKLFGADDTDRNEVGKWITMVHPLDKQWVSDHIQQKLDDPDAESWEVEFRYYSHDGEIAYLYDRGFIIRDDNKKPVRMVGATTDITKRKNAEMLLHKSEERYRQIVETAEEGIWLVDEDHKTSFVNKRLCEIFGYTAADMMGKDIFYFMDEEGKKIAAAAMAGRKKGNTESLDFKFITAAGEVIWTYLVNSPVFDDEGKYVGALAMVTDITERKEAEEKVIESEKYTRNLFNQSTVGLALAQMDGTLEDINEAYAKITGRTIEECKKLSYWEITPEKYRTDELQRLAVLELTGRYGPYEKEYMHKDGHLVPVRLSGTILERDGIKYIWSSVEDITESKKAKAELLKSEERYRQIVETAQEGIWLIDENNYTVFVNKKLCEMLEYTEEEMIGRQNYFFKDEQERQRAAEQIERRKQGISENHDSTYITKTGRLVWGHVSSNPIFNEDGVYIGALAMITNITQRKLNDQLLLQSEANLEIKNRELERKNKELEQFAYVASHDLQEPLRTTSSFVKLFQQQYIGKLDEKADKYLAYIVESSDRMKVLINDLLEYSRIGSKKELKQVDCNKMLTEVLADIGMAIHEAEAEIEATPLPVISGYPTEIKQLFQNLIVNAIKFRKKNTIPEIKISARREDEYWQFAFADNGIGIAPDQTERIFIIFQRLHTRTEYAGSGIGLSHCKKIVELHKGKIWVESVPGEGSTFYFTLPAHQGDINQNNIYEIKTELRADH